MYETFKKFIRNKILLAVLSIILGVILIVRQKAAIDSLVYLVGIILLIAAVVFLIYFFMQKEKQPAQLILAILSLILGLLFAIKPGLIVDIFPVLMGIILILSGLADLGHSITAPKGTGGRIFLILFSILVILVGVLCLFRPGAIANALALFLGICLLYNGIFDLILMIMVKEETK